MKQSEHLDKAEEALRELQAYDDWEEPTARTDVHVHIDRGSQADIVTDESERKPVHWVKLVIGATVTAVLAWLANRFGSKP